MAETDEPAIPHLKTRCENCGATLTEAEKAVALERETSPVLCSICAAELEPATEPGPEPDAS